MILSLDETFLERLQSAITWNMLQVVQLSHYIKFMGQSNNFHLIFIILMETQGFKVTMQVIKSVN